MCRVKNFLSGILIFATGQIAYSQTIIPIDTVPLAFHVNHYETNNGLMQNTIKDLAFDNAGFLWMITEKGVSRFDGQTFAHYYDPDLPLENGNRSGGLGLLDSVLYLNNLPRFPIRNGKLEIKIGASFSKKVDFGVGKQFSTPDNNRFFGLVKKDTILPYYDSQYNQPFFQLNDSVTYVSNNDCGLSYLVNGRVIEKTRPIYVVVDGIKYPQLHNYFLLENTLYLRDRNNRFIEFQNGKRFREYQLDVDLGEFSVYWTKKAGTYLLSEGRVFQIIKELDSIHIQLLYNLPEGEASHILPFQNKDGYFIGTRRNGLFELRQKQFQSLYYEKSPQRNNLRDLLEIGRDSLISEHRILYTQSGTTDLIKLPPESIFKDPFQLLTFNSLISTPLKLAPGNEKIDPKFLYYESVIMDTTGRYWYSTDYGTLQFKDTVQVYVDSNPDTVMDCRGAFYDPYNNEILTAYKGSVRAFSISDKTYRRLPGFSSHHTRNIIFQEPGLSWFCMIGEGLHSWDGEDLTVYPLDKRQSLKYSHTVVKDNEGYLWISTDNGLLMAHSEDLKNYRNGKTESIYYYRFDKKNGFLTNEFNGGGVPCGLQLKTNKIAFASLHGVVLFDPSEVKLPYSNGKLIMDQILVDNVDTLIDPQIGLDQNFEQLEFKIAFPYFGDLENLPIQYKIEGLQEKWTSVPSENIIRLRKPRFGYYKLIVRKHNGFGLNNYSYLNYSIKINPKFYQTLGFKYGTGFIIVLLILGVFIISNWVDKRQRTRLEEIILEKTQDQLKLNEELKLSLAKVRRSEELLKSNAKMKDKFMTIYVHDVRGPLRFVQTVINSSINRIKEGDQSQLIQRLENIKTSTNQVFQLTEHMFKWLGTQKEQFELKTTRLSLDETINSVLDQFTKQAENKGNVLRQETSKPLWVHSDENVLTIVLSNIIDNAVKFTVNGEIIVRTNELKDHLVINITDTGRGIDKAELTQMQKGVFSSQEGTDGEKGTGFGLKTIRELLLMIHGFMQIESELDKGTSVSIFLEKDIIDPSA